VALRGEGRGESYCSCPDFRTNTLGTCKHILYALDRVAKKFPAAKRRRRPRLWQTMAGLLLAGGAPLPSPSALPDA